MFANARSFQINDGQFNVAGRDIIQTWYSVDPLQALWYAIKDVGATHNSEIRQPPPKCHPDTRQEVLVVLHDWIYSPWHSEPVFWLYGPAGAGKSAIAQTLAELGQQERYLASSFFFSRLHPRKNNASTLFLSIAYELAASTPELQEPVGQAIKRNPAIIQASLEEQFQKLIVEPCRLLQQLHSHVWVIIIDGLDECIGSREQKRILAILATALPKGIHLRFLVCSRPEPPIREAFDTDAFRPYLRRVALDWTFNPGRDIKTFLTNEFERIRNDPRNTHIQFPVPWPATGIIEELVQKSSGQFIYPATVVKFVDNEYTDPCMQLQSVLHPVPHPSSELISPFHDLDVLYRHILSCNPQRSKVREIIWALTLIPMSKTTLRRTPREVGALLLFDAGEIISALRGMHSIFEIGGPDDFIRPLHASFDDFLRDATRSGYYYMGDARNQHTLLTRWLLRAFTLYTGTNMKKTSERWEVHSAAWYNWGYHCSRSTLDNEVLDHLRKVDFTKTFEDHIRSVRGAHKVFNGTTHLHFAGIVGFFSQIEFLTRQLLVNDNVANQVIWRFSDFMRGFQIKVSHPNALWVLNGFAVALCCVLVGPSLLWWEQKNPHILEFCHPQSFQPEGFPPEGFQVISIGNDCHCTRSKEASLHLSLPCCVSTLEDVYHIQMSVAMRTPLRLAMHHVEGWHVDSQGGLTRRGQYTIGTCYLCTALGVCGPCPELLDLLPPLLPKIESKRDQDGLLKWLQSFPPEYAAQISPLIATVGEIRCTWHDHDNTREGGDTQK